MRALPQDKLTGSDHAHTTTGNVAGVGNTFDTTGGATRTTGVTAGTAAGTHTHQPVGEKLKDALHVGGHHGGTSTGVANEHLVGGVPVTRKDSSSSSSSSDDEGGKVMGTGKQFTAVEEHAVVKDHVTVVREHHPKEVRYVTEVKEVGVRELPTRVEHLGTSEKVVQGGVTHDTGNVAAGTQTNTTSGMMSGSTAHDTTTTHELK